MIIIVATVHQDICEARNIHDLNHPLVPGLAIALQIFLMHASIGAKPQLVDSRRDPGLMHDLLIPVLIFLSVAQELQEALWFVPKEQPLGVILRVIESNQLRAIALSSDTLTPAFVPNPRKAANFEGATNCPLFSLSWFSFLLGMPRIRLMILIAAKILREDVPAGKPWQQKNYSYIDNALDCHEKPIRPPAVYSIWQLDIRTMRINCRYRPRRRCRH